MQQLVATHVAKWLNVRGGGGYAGVQYAILNDALTGYTENLDKFLTGVNGAKQLGFNETFVSAGLNYCITEALFAPPGKKRIVVIGSGISTIGADPILRADLFFGLGGKVLTVGAGPNQDFETLKEIAAGDAKSVFSITEGKWWRVAQNLTKALCN